MSNILFDLPPEEITARLRAVVATAAGEPVAIHVGEKAHGRSAP